MRLLYKLDVTDELYIPQSDMLTIFNEESTQFLINYEFKNPLLKCKVWSKLFEIEPNLIETEQGKVYKYLTSSLIEMPKDYSIDAVKKFWDLPGVIPTNLMKLLDPRLYELYSNLDSLGYYECLNLVNLLNIYPTKALLGIQVEVNSRYKKLLSKKDREDKELEEHEANKAHMYPIDTYEPINIVRSLLVIDGYDKYLTKAKELEYLIWLSTGWRLTDIIDTITKYVKVQDRIYCTILPTFLTTADTKYDSENFGLNNSAIYEFYLSECEKIAKRDGRVPKMYPGYSLDTLRSSVNRKPQSTNFTPKVSEYEVLEFINSHLDKPFEWTEVKDYLSWMGNRGIHVMHSDSGDGYVGISIDSDAVPDLNRRLLKYERTELYNIRKLLVGIVDEKVKVSKMPLEDVVNFDGELACQMISQICDMEYINYNQLMSDMKWISILGHMGVKLRKVSKDIYQISFNSISIPSTLELVCRCESELGYEVAKKVISRYSKLSKFYLSVLDSLTPATWELFRCQTIISQNLRLN